MANNIINNGLITDLRHIIDQGRRQAYISINASMILTYWNVGRRIVEEEQHGKERAEYGTGILKNIASELTPEFGDNFSDRRLRDYRQFYIYFNNLENWHSRMPNLTWTHIRHLLRVDDEKARLWYMKEAATQMWSTRELERNILSQYYYRLLSNQKDKDASVVDVHAGEPVLPEKGEFRRTQSYIWHYSMR